MHISGTETFGHDKYNDNGLINRFGEENATTTQVPPVNANCADVGGKVRKAASERLIDFYAHATSCVSSASKSLTAAPA